MEHATGVVRLATQLLGTECLAVEVDGRTRVRNRELRSECVEAFGQASGDDPTEPGSHPTTLGHQGGP
jgi:hypothetical protein